MSIYTHAIKAGIVLFPLLALIITLPYMIRQYHRYGSIILLRSIIVYSFALYLLISFFLVILPLPKIEYVRTLNTPYVQLEPFRFIKEIGSYSTFVVNDFSTYLPALKHSVLYTNIFNILLTVPFGIYLRYYFKRGFIETFVLSLLLSLFFEVTQLTGIFGIYPRPYRIFDVDDLIVNTLGGCLGYLITPLFVFMLPSRDKLDEKSRKKGEVVTFTRRLTAYVIDFTLYSSFIFLLIMLSINITFTNFFLGLFFYELITSILFKGSTIGKRMVRIKVVCDDLKYYLLNTYIRYASRYIIFVEVLDIIYYIYHSEYFNSFTSVSILILLIILIIIYINTVISLVMDKPLIYEKLSKTRVISTLSNDDNSKINP